MTKIKLLFKISTAFTMLALIASSSLNASRKQKDAERDMERKQRAVQRDSAQKFDKIHNNMSDNKNVAQDYVKQQQDAYRELDKEFERVHGKKK